MKKIFTFFTVLACTMAVFTACAGDEHVIEPPLPAAAEIEGEPTYATFSFRPDRVEAGTRAPMQTDTNEPDPSTITFNDIRLLVFDAANTCEIDTTFANNPQQTATVQMISGQKRVLVIANTAGKAKLASRMPKMTGITYTQFQSDYNLHDLGTPAVSTGLPVASLDLSELIQTSDPASSMVYSSSEKESIVIVQPGVTAAQSQNPTGPNHLDITLKRLVVKVTLATSLASPIWTADSCGWVQDLKYSIRNVNRSLYLFQNYDASNVLVSPYGHLTSPFTPYYYRGYDLVDLLPASSPVAPVYVTENVPVTPYGGNTTYAVIEAVFVPRPKCAIAGIGYNEATQTFSPFTHTDAITPGSDLYVFREVGILGLPVGSVFVDSVSVYKVAYHIKNPSSPPLSLTSGYLGYMTDLGDDVKRLFKKYTGGKAYYRYNFGEQSGGPDTDINYGIKRNHHYVANISAFSTIGASRPEELLGPGEVTEVTEGVTNITASFTVEPWIIDYITNAT